jgi:3',5'-cyclic-AMP phosphodiesterase
MRAEPVLFAHVSDTHFGPTPDYVRHGFAAHPCAERLVDILNDLPARPDFVVHTGDVVTEPDDRAYALAAATFARLELPVYYVTGNHDTAAHIRRWLPMGPRQPLAEADGPLCYSFDVRDHRFLVIDARGPDRIDPRGLLYFGQLAVLDRELGPEGPPLTVFCHFPALPMGIPWIDETMLILNGAELHQRLVACGPRLRGVFFGHIHQAASFHRDGVLYSAAPSAFAQLGGLPTDRVARVDAAAPPGFQLVRVSDEGTTVRVCSFERPAQPPPPPITGGLETGETR